MIEDKKKLDDKRAADMKLQEERKAVKSKVEDSKKRTGTPTAAGEIPFCSDELSLSECSRRTQEAQA